MERFAFVLHPLRVSDFARKFPVLNRLPERLVETAFRAVPPFKVSHITGVRSNTGAEAEGWFVGLPLTARMLLELPFPKVLPRLIQAGHVAEQLGAQILGLGSFTKVIGDRGVSVNDALSIPVTTGNSYTSASAVEGALLGATRLGIEPKEAEVAVIGATGAIGKACASIMTGEVRRLVLVGRRSEALDEIAQELMDLGTETEISVSLDPRAAARTADIVLTVSSAPGVLLEPEDLKPGAVVCDVARPRNVSANVYEHRKDVLVIDGGVIAVPGPVDFHFNFGFPPGFAEACISETMILALERRYEPFTLGADIQPEKLREITTLAKKHGFSVAGFRRFEKAISDEEVEQIREKAEQARRTEPRSTSA